MFILRLLRFLAGSVEFSAFGAFPERFLNLCTQNHIPLWSVRCGQSCVTACTLARRYKKMRAFARKSGVKLKSGKRRGLPFLLHRYRRRVGLLSGIVLFAAILCTLSCFTWTVEITGNTVTDEQTIRDTLSTLGLRPGVLTSSIDPEELSRSAMLKLPELSWLTVNLKGSSALIEVRERIIPPIVIPEDQPCNIVADVPGQIVTLEVYAGRAEVQKGDAVTEGQLLVSGTIEDSNGKTLLKHAEANIVAITTRSITVEVPLEETVDTPSGESVDKRSIGFFGLDIPLYWGLPEGDQYQISSIEKPLSIGSLNLPLSVKIRRYTPVVQETITRTKEQAAQKAAELLAEQESIELSNLEIINKNKVEKFTNIVYHLTMEYQCKEKIGIQEEILLNG